MSSFLTRLPQRAAFCRFFVMNCHAASLKVLSGLPQLGSSDRHRSTAGGRGILTLHRPSVSAGTGEWRRLFVATSAARDVALAYSRCAGKVGDEPVKPHGTERASWFTTTHWSVVLGATDASAP